VIKKNDTRRLKIAIGPWLRNKYGPEIYWTWRMLLSTIGLPWEETSVNDPDCDIAYVVEGESRGNSKLCIKGNKDYWEHASEHQFEKMENFNGWLYPVFQHKDVPSQPFCSTDGCLIFKLDIIFYVFWLATGKQETHLNRNKHGHFHLDKYLPYKNTLCEALASSISLNLETMLVDLGFEPQIRRWPNGKQAAACVSHDVDYPEVIRWLEPLRILHRNRLKGFKAAMSVFTERRNHWHFESWISLEKRLNTRSAFYFSAKQGSLFKYIAGTPDTFYNIRSKRYKDLLKYLVAEGFEVGLHASYKAFESQEKIIAEKSLLEEVVGQDIHGNRHHYWHLNPECPESTLLLHEQAGLKYDASLSHERYLGWRRGLSWPFFPFHQKQRRQLGVLQLPTAWMDNHLFGYRNYNPGNASTILQNVTEKTIEQGGCLLINIHDYAFDGILFPGWSKTYFQLWEHIVSRSDFWIETPERIASYWIERYQSILQNSKGLDQ